MEVSASAVFENTPLKLQINLDEGSLSSTSIDTSLLNKSNLLVTVSLPLSDQVSFSFTNGKIIERDSKSMVNLKNEINNSFINHSTY